jgi:ribosome recycling factor
MKGSWSIKAVLPTIDPALSYENLGALADGEGAQLAFLEIRDPKTSEERRTELEGGLKRYCERDTWGLVVLRRFLSGEGVTK